MAFCPLPVGHGIRATGQLGCSPHEAQTDVFVGVLCLDGKHLATVLWGEEPFGFNHHAIGQDEIRRVGSGDGVGQGLAFVVEGQAPFV